MAKSWNLQSQLLVAIQNNKCEKVRELVEQKGLDPDCVFSIGGHRKPAVCLCVQRNNLHLLEYLVSRECSVNRTDSLGHSPLHLACANSYERLVAYLLSNRANVNAVTPQGHSPLHIAAKTDSLNIVQLLVEADAQVDRVDSEGKTPILNACITGHLDIADFLLNAGANVNSRSLCGNTPLLFAASSPSPHTGLLSRLLAAGASINHQNQQGESALHAVLRSNNKQRSEAVELLIAHPRCNLELRTNLGHAPLHLAALQHDKQSVIALLRKGCQLSPKDKLNLTPLFCCCREGDEELVRLLVTAGARLEDEDWLADPSYVATTFKKPWMAEWLVSMCRQCPKLTDICRSRLRVRSPSCQVEDLLLPQTLKQFLLFEAL